MSPTPMKKTKIQITIRNEFYSRKYRLSTDIEIDDLKALTSKYFKVNVETIIFIFNSKKVAMSVKTLAEIGIENNGTLHFINFNFSTMMRSKTRFPFNIDNYRGINSLKMFKNPNLTLCEIQSEMQREFLKNPSLLKKTLEQPTVQMFMKNADSIKKLVENNPFMQSLYEKYPVIKKLIADDETLNQSTELAKNPDVLVDLLEKDIRLHNTENNDSAENVQKKEHSSLFTAETFLTDLEQNPEILRSMIENPYFKEVLKSYKESPEKAVEIFYETGLYGNNPLVKEKIRKLTPSILDIFTNNSFRNVYENPELLKCHINMHLNYARMLKMCPGVYFDILNVDKLAKSTQNIDKSQGNVNKEDNSHCNTDVDMSESYYEDSNNDTSDGNRNINVEVLHTSLNAPQSAFLDFQNYFQNIIDGVVSKSSKASSYVKYASHLDRLKKMGFTETEKYISILGMTNGDFNATVCYLLNQDL